MYMYIYVYIIYIYFNDGKPRGFWNSMFSDKARFEHRDFMVSEPLRTSGASLSHDKS
jgi:hypothetical protein